MQTTTTTELPTTREKPMSWDAQDAKTATLAARKAADDAQRANNIADVRRAAMVATKHGGMAVEAAYRASLKQREMYDCEMASDAWNDAANALLAAAQAATAASRLELM